MTDQQPAADTDTPPPVDPVPEPGAGPQPSALETAETAAQENWSKYLRAAAELDNVRKRAARDVEQARKFAVERFATDLLPVLDSLEKGLESGSAASAQSLLDGKEATLRLLLSTLDKFGIEAVKADGQPFDPQLHEALSMVSVVGVTPGSVLKVVQQGYVLNGRLLRPARVVVAAQAPGGAPGDAPAPDQPG
ncbi:MAG: nucleotide exchange factor GrpE [Gammaproteobacteria bacterium]|nr:nucleotide exchange factor GrpE [Gammaproteobacteria bacterium]